jgi:hypothetical protein
VDTVSGGCSSSSRSEARVTQREGVAAAVVELDTPSDAVGAATEDEQPAHQHQIRVDACASLLAATTRIS